MKLSEQVIFFSIVFFVYGLINFYIGYRAFQVVPANLRISFIPLFILIVISYIVGRLLESFYPSFISTMFIWIGSFWIAFMVYFLLSVLLIDILRLANYLFGIFPKFILQNSVRAGRITAIIIISITSIVVIAGHINTYFPKIKTLTLHVEKTVSDLKELNIVLVTDIHLGITIGESFLTKIAEAVNNLSPDIILLAGDTIDEDVAPVIRNNGGAALKILNAKYGVYAITGNHEYIGGVNAASKYLIDHDINLLRDSTILIDNKFYLIGREDRDIVRFAGKQRLPLTELMKNVDVRLPVILMDHQPFNLEEAMIAGIDLQVSGHTHNGQMWPLNFITDMVYELGWGYKQKGNTHYYVSCGVGGWGPPIRTGSRPEIIKLNLFFDK